MKEIRKKISELNIPDSIQLDCLDERIVKIITKSIWDNLLEENIKLKEKIEWLQHSWIPTSERLPNEKEFMRNYSRDNHSTEFVVMIEGATIPTVLQYKRDGVWTDEARNWYNVVAWMEFPDPWKGDLE